MSFSNKSLLAFCLLFIFQTTLAQEYKTDIDSLIKQLQAEQLNRYDSIVLSIQLSKEYGESNPDSAIQIINPLISLIRIEKNDSLLAHAFIAKASAYNYKADYPKSTALAMDALAIGEGLKDTTAIFDAINLLAINFMYGEDYNSSYNYFTQSIELAKALNDSIRIGHAYNNIGLIEYYRGNDEKELAFYERAKVIFEEIGEIEGLGNTLLNIGTVYTANENYALADSYYQRALQQFEKIAYQSAYVHVYESMAENFLASGNYNEAKLYAIKALNIAELNELNQDVIYLYDLLQQIFIELGDYKRAHSYLEKYHLLNEEIFNEEKSKQVKELQTQYETVQKEALIERLSLKNELQQVNLKRSRNLQVGIVIIGFLIIILVIVFFTLRHKKQLLEREAQELQLDALKKRFMELHASPSELAVSVNFEELNSRLNTPLTEREFEALQLSLEGKTNAEIGDKLFISVSTVKFHLRNTYTKIGVGNRKEAFQYMLKTT